MFVKQANRIMSESGMETSKSKTACMIGFFASLGANLAAPDDWHHLGTMELFLPGAAMLLIFAFQQQTTTFSRILHVDLRPSPHRKDLRHFLHYVETVLKTKLTGTGSGLTQKLVEALSANSLHHVICDGVEEMLPGASETTTERLSIREITFMGSIEKPNADELHIGQSYKLPLSMVQPIARCKFH